MDNSHRLRKHRHSTINNVYCVTFCTKNRTPTLLDHKIARGVIHAMKHQDNQNKTLTYAFVVMPDHIHWLFALTNSTLDKILHSIKSFTSTKYKQLFWQRGFYEHTIRQSTDLIKLSRYIVANPLRANLVKNIGDYPFWEAVWLNTEI